MAQIFDRPDAASTHLHLQVDTFDGGLSFITANTHDGDSEFVDFLETDVRDLRDALTQWLERQRQSR